MLPETFEAVQGGEAGLCVARPSCAPQHQAVAEHEFKNLHKKAASGVKIRMRQMVYKWFVLLFSLAALISLSMAAIFSPIRFNSSFNFSIFLFISLRRLLPFFELQVRKPGCSRTS